MKWYSWLICAVLVVTGIFNLTTLVEMFSVKNAEYGSIISIETINNYTEVAKFDYGVINFETSDYVNYSSVESFERVDFDGENDNYALLFNGNLLSDIKIYSGKIEASYTQNFYNTSGDLVANPTLDIEMEFYDSGTIITILTENKNDSISYLNQYMGLHGAIFKLVEKGE